MKKLLSLLAVLPLTLTACGKSELETAADEFWGNFKEDAPNSWFEYEDEILFITPSSSGWTSWEVWKAAIHINRNVGEGRLMLTLGYSSRGSLPTIDAAKAEFIEQHTRWGTPQITCTEGGYNDHYFDKILPEQIGEKGEDWNIAAIGKWAFAKQAMTICQL